MDLVALNIQRGRDHGLPGYNAFRELCGLGRVNSFQLLADLIPAKLVERLRLLYTHVDDIDLFVGGISEISEVESLLGEITLPGLCDFVTTGLCFRSNIQMSRGGSVR